MLAKKYDNYDYDDNYDSYGYQSQAARKAQNKPNTELPKKPLAHKPKVFKTSRINVAERRKIIWMSFVFIFLVFATLLRNQCLMDTGVMLVKSQRMEAEQSKINELLKVEVAQLSSPERITNIASSKLGMVVVKQNYYLQGSEADKNNSSESYWEQAKDWLGF